MTKPRLLLVPETMPLVDDERPVDRNATTQPEIPARRAQTDQANAGRYSHVYGRSTPRRRRR